MVPGFLLSGVAIVLFSLLDKAPSMRMQQDFAQMEAEMANPGVSLTAPVAD
jgi:sodium/proline symporter